MNFAGLSSFHGFDQFVTLQAAENFARNCLNPRQIIRAERPQIDAADAQSLAAYLPLFHALAGIQQQSPSSSAAVPAVNPPLDDNNAYSPRQSGFSHQFGGHSSQSNTNFASPAGEMRSSAATSRKRGRVNSENEDAFGADVLLGLRVAQAVSSSPAESTDNNVASAGFAEPSGFRLSRLSPHSASHAAAVSASPSRGGQAMADFDLNALPDARLIESDAREVEQKSGGSATCDAAEGGARKKRPRGRQQPIKTCPKCGRQFSTGQALGGHMRKHFDGPLNTQKKQLLARTGRVSAASESSVLVASAPAAQQRTIDGDARGSRSNQDMRRELDLSLSL